MATKTCQVTGIGIPECSCPSCVKLLLAQHVAEPHKDSSAVPALAAAAPARRAA
jgi:hypothetical protein